jgi:gluconokinase
MGVSGSGKTTIGRLLAERLGVAYAEADAFHPAANIAKMAAGQALDDDDRYPWLRAIAAWISARDGAGGVVSCSALKVRYRDVLREADPALWFVHLVIPKGTVQRRVGARSDHFMPESLVESQFEALEDLEAGEAGMTVDSSAAPEQIVSQVLGRLRAA